MKKNLLRRIALTGVIGTMTVLGTSSIASAQRRSQDRRQDQKQEAKSRAKG